MFLQQVGSVLIIVDLNFCRHFIWYHLILQLLSTRSYLSMIFHNSFMYVLPILTASYKIHSIGLKVLCGRS